MKKDIKIIYEKLPMKCCTFVKSSGTVGLITKGVRGYMPLLDATIDFVNDFNERNGVDEATKKAMEMGSLCGWDVEGINPEFYKG